ncbi:MAG TPA: D-arabinono-1,4-lactone oxidase [Natronosporangium sp.]
MTVGNWAGNIRFAASRLHQPSSVDELRRLVAAAPRIKALGTGHSFSRIADTAGELVSLAGLPATVEVDQERGTAKVPAGIRYGELAGQLHQAGYGLPGMASLPHISVAGACATATHGSGNRVGNLATAVSAVELVTADGSLVTLTRDDDRFAGAVVGLGALGVVTSLTLDLVPAFEVAQYVYDQLPYETLLEQPDEIFGTAYSVSVFTSWRHPYADQVWLKHREPWDAPQRWLGARRADGPRHPIAGMPAVNCTEQLGVPGPWYARLPHFRLEFTPSNGEELQSEYLIPREATAEALTAIHGIRDRIAPVLQICELRTVAADDLWLSMSYQRDSTAIHFTWVADPDAVAPVIAAIEERLAPFDPRPHWGKLFSVPPQVLAQRYPRLPDFAALVREFDPTGKFRNDFLDRYLP